jgi:hypothetical protein
VDVDVCGDGPTSTSRASSSQGILSYSFSSFSSSSSSLSSTSSSSPSADSSSDPCWRFSHCNVVRSGASFFTFFASFFLRISSAARFTAHAVSSSSSSARESWTGLNCPYKHRPTKSKVRIENRESWRRSGSTHQVDEAGVRPHHRMTLDRKIVLGSSSTSQMCCWISKFWSKP